MIYDQPVNHNDVQKTPANIVINSESSQRVDPNKIIQTNYLQKVAAKKVTSGSTQRIDINKFSNNLSNITRTTSTAKCAKSVRIALQSAGAKIVNHPVAAADWGGTLKKIGYKEITPAFHKPQKGDIYIIDRTHKHVYGHIAAYSGSNWVSDFRQKSHVIYKDKVNYKYYRLSA